MRMKRRINTRQQYSVLCHACIQTIVHHAYCILQLMNKRQAIAVKHIPNIPVVLLVEIDYDSKVAMETCTCGGF